MYLSNKDRKEIKEIVAKIHHIIELEECPPLEQKKICNKCSYYDFCYANEMK
ncbi:MAG: Dna2/Cas4 domain-containing protein [Bacteroidales bacterium]